MIMHLKSYCFLNSCWIETEQDAIWGFVAPMLAIIIVRFVVVTFIYYVCSNAFGNI